MLSYGLIHYFTRNITNGVTGDELSESDPILSVVSGALTGTFYKSTKGPRVMALSAGIGAAAACAYEVGKLVAEQLELD